MSRSRSRSHCLFVYKIQRTHMLNMKWEICTKTLQTHRNKKQTFIKWNKGEPPLNGQRQMLPEGRGGNPVPYRSRSPSIPYKWNSVNKSPRAQRRSPWYKIKRFLKIFLWKTDKPLGGASIGPGVRILTILVKGHLVILHTKYLISRLGGFRRRFLKSFLWKSDKPMGGASLSPGVIILTILVKGH